MSADDPFTKPFPITILCREDIATHLVDSEDYDPESSVQVALSFTDAEMEHLASEIADAIMNSFWEVVCDAALAKAEELKRKGRA